MLTKNDKFVCCLIVKTPNIGRMIMLTLEEGLFFILEMILKMCEF